MSSGERGREFEGPVFRGKEGSSEKGRAQGRVQIRVRVRIKIKD